MALRLQVALALVPVLATTYSADELVLLGAEVSKTPLAPQFEKFADRLDETKAVAGFLQKTADLILPPLPSVVPPVDPAAPVDPAPPPSAA